MRSASRDTLLLFAKRPEPGRVKTRLCPPWSHEKAARFYACLLEDVLEATASFARGLDMEAVLCLDPLAEGARTRPFSVPAAFSLEAQQGVGLASRMENAVRAAFERGARRVLLRGSDTPCSPRLIWRRLSRPSRSTISCFPRSRRWIRAGGLFSPVPRPT